MADEIEKKLKRFEHVIELCDNGKVAQAQDVAEELTEAISIIRYLNARVTMRDGKHPAEDDFRRAVANGDAETVVGYLDEFQIMFDEQLAVAKELRAERTAAHSALCEIAEEHAFWDVQRDSDGAPCEEPDHRCPNIAKAALANLKTDVHFTDYPQTLDDQSTETPELVLCGRSTLTPVTITTDPGYVTCVECWQILNERGEFR